MALKWIKEKKKEKATRFNLVIKCKFKHGLEIDLKVRLEVILESVYNIYNT